MKYLPGVTGLILFKSLAVVGMGRSETDTPESLARRIFPQFVELGQAFDPVLADLYVDGARIVSIQKSPNGTERILEMRGTEHKALIRGVMPTAKAHGDASSFGDASYWREGLCNRVSATRFSALKKYASLYSLVEGSDVSGRWLTYEEHRITKQSSKQPRG